MSKTLLIEDICKECGSTSFATTISDIVCSECGTVFDRIIEGSHFLERGKEGEKTGSPESRRSKSTFFKVYDAHSAEKREKYRRLFNVANSQYDAIEENKSRLLGILTRIGLSENQRNDIMFELKRKYNDERRKGNKITNIFLIAAALTIRFMKNQGRATSINDIVALFKAHGCKLSAKAVRDYIIENNLNYRTSSAKEFIPKYMTKIRTNAMLRDRLSQINPDDEFNVEKMLTTIEKLAHKLSEIKTNGRRPSVFSVSCIFLATNLVGQRYLGQQLISKEEISRYCQIPATTLRQHCKYVMDHLKLNL
jgi:transcription initiation factor TFIIIB Brf1 subunit/transcription initiation factor TFIIB